MEILSILFFDVKCAFDYVSKSRLLDTMKRLHLHSSVIRWTDSSPSHRQTGLAFGCERENLQPVNTGMPQESPISPVLFLTYLRFLFITIQHKHPHIATPSYVDDVARLVGDTEEENFRKLEAIAKTALSWVATHLMTPKPNSSTSAGVGKHPGARPPSQMALSSDCYGKMARSVL